MPPDRPRRERIDMAVFGVAPDFVRMSLRLVGADLAASPAPAAALLRRAGQAARALSDSDARLMAWREPYFALSIPDDVLPPPAILARWAATAGGVPSLGPLLDLVNAFALQSVAPVAAYDLAGASGDLWLRPSRGIERHEALSSDAATVPPIGELILADSADGVLARHWHGAPGRATMVRGPTAEVLVHLDLLPPSSARAAAMADRLARLLVGFLGGSIDIRRLDRGTPQALWLP